MKLVITRCCTLPCVVLCTLRSKSVDSNALVFLVYIPVSSTLFAQALSIEFLANFGDLFTDHIVQFDGLFNFFNGMNCGRVVFAAKLIGYLWKTKVKLAAEQVHGDLTRHNNVFIALCAAYLGR